MPLDTMTPRERWLAVMRRQKPDRTPTDYWGTPEIAVKLVRHLGAASLPDALERLHVDYLVQARPRYVGPELAPGMDAFGVYHRDVDYGTGVYSEAASHPLAGFHSVEEIQAAYRWPDPDWWDYSGIPDRVRGHEDRAVRGGGSEPFLTYKELRGDEQALVDLIENPEIVEYCLGKLFDLAYTDTLRIYEAIPGRVEFSYVAEDMGGQSELMVAPRHLRRFLFPGMKRMIELAHSAGVYVFHHNDGNITRILPELVELGIDILNPIQWRAGAQPSAPNLENVVDSLGPIPPAPFPLGKGEKTKRSGEILPPEVAKSPPLPPLPFRGGRGGEVRFATADLGGKASSMDRAMLKQRYGEKLVFHGAMDNQYTLPFGTLAEVQREVCENLRLLGAGGGYILAPCHNVQALTPVENVLAMYEAAHELGRT